MRIERQTIFLGFALLLFAFSNSSQAQAVVQVAAESVAQQDRLVLGDVAEVRASEAEITARLCP
jgi:hypothetical protein